MRILAIHGVGHGDAQTGWQDEWRQATAKGLQAWSPALAPEIEFLQYDDFFAKADLGAAEVLEALWRLSASGLFYGITDKLRVRGGLSSAMESVRWSAGLVAQWVALEDLRQKLRDHLAAEIARVQPDVILAHSLGSLIAYDTLRRDEVAGGTLSDALTLVTFGSQIGNPAVRSVYGGRIDQLEKSRFWWHLYNAEDDVFTCPVGLPSRDKFRQVDTFFDIAGYADHDGATYLGHADTGLSVWQDIAAAAVAAGAVSRARGASAAARPAQLAPAHARVAAKAKPAELRQKALLVGIAEYPEVKSRLEGPVNDVFSVSAALQELGFPADGIRVVLNDRATTQGIRERLKWLLDEPQPGDQLVFYFAGHGAQVPGYGRDSEVDRIDECLVPYDFDWSRGNAISDDELAALYAQLPYECNFTVILDCCHSGGMARAGGLLARALTPPDDIRHRMLRWDKATQMWHTRKQLEAITGAEAATIQRAGDQDSWLGSSGSMRRMGRGTSLWMPSARDFQAARKANDHYGPYVPVMLQACGEGELAYEYKHGVTSHGAFTYSLCGVLRDAARHVRGSPMTFSELMGETARRVASVVTEAQNPQLHCANVWRDKPIPGL